MACPTSSLDAPSRDVPSLDAYVGARVRARRKALGQTQAQLAEAIEVSFQQLQKYERGANRLSVARLHAIACAQVTDIGWYVEGFEAASVELAFDQMARPATPASVNPVRPGTA
jgi:transcriptional regulator with XRE-family HTH domain